VPSYVDNPLVPFEDLLASCTDNLRFVLGNLAGTPAISIDAPRSTGARRAEQGMPYAVVLQAFRVGGRFIWELLVDRADEDARDVLLRAAADIWSVTDDLSSAVTDAYHAALTERARRDGQMRGVLVGTLLDGDIPDGDHSWDATAILNLRGTEYVVVSAECASPGTEALPEVEQVLTRQNVSSAWRLDHDRHEGVVALRVGFGVARLVDKIGGTASGRVGLSIPFPRIDDASEGCRQARLAMAAATPGSVEVVRFEEQPIGVLLAAAPDNAEALARRVLGPVIDQSPDDAAIILETARTWLAAAGSTSAAAKTLHLHRNTVRYRLRRLEELTGRGLTHPVEAAEVYVALESARIRGLG